MALRNGRRSGGMSRSQRRLLIRLVLAAAVAVLIVVRYTSPRSIFNPVSSGEPASKPR